jgi:hypothetical protein
VKTTPLKSCDLMLNPGSSNFLRRGQGRSITVNAIARHGRDWWTRRFCQKEEVQAIRTIFRINGDSVKFLDAGRGDRGIESDQGAKTGPRSSRRGGPATGTPLHLMPALARRIAEQL